MTEHTAPARKPATGRRLRITPRLPGDGEDISYLVGATICRVGTARLNGQEVFAIEYQHEQDAPTTALLRFSELGLWSAKSLRR